MRCAQGVKSQAGEERFVTSESGVLENTGQVWVGNDFFDNGIFPGWVRIRAAVSQDMVRHLFEFGLEMPLFVVEKALAVGDEVLKVPELWPVHRRKVNFGEDAFPEGKPDPAGSCVSSTQPILCSMRPSGLDAGPPKSLHLLSISLGWKKSKRRQKL